MYLYFLYICVQEFLIFPKQSFMAKSQNSQLSRARAAKKDEFYTQLPNIENELSHNKW